MTNKYVGRDNYIGLPSYLNTDTVNVTCTAGETIQAGRYVYMDTKDGRVYKTDYTNERKSTKSFILGINTADVTVGNEATVTTFGKYELTTFLTSYDGAGYFAGGYTGSYPYYVTALTERIIFATGVVLANTVSNLSSARYRLAGISDGSTYGYFASYNITDRIIYSIGVTSANSVSNVLARDYLAGVSDNTTYGYFAGYTSGVTYAALTDRIIFATGVTSANTVSNLSTARDRLAGLSDGTTYGYFAGGGYFNPSFTITDIADRIVFATGVTSANTVSDLSVGRDNLVGISDNSTYGYFSGGETVNGSANSCKITDRIVFTTGITSANTASNLSVVRGNFAGISDNSTYGYFAGGNSGGGVVQTTDRIIFTTGITSARANSKLSMGRANLVGLSGYYTKTLYNHGDMFYLDTDGLANNTVRNSIAGLILYDNNLLLNRINTYINTTTTTSKLYGYFSGGYTAAAAATADRIVFSTGVTTANTASNLSSVRYGVASAGGSLYGYFAGGNSGAYVATSDKLTYSTSANAANTASNLSLARSNLAGVSNITTYGYFAGGYSSASAYVATTDKLTYSTGITAVNTVSNLSDGKGEVSGVSSILSNTGYYCGGTKLSDIAKVDKLVMGTGILSALTQTLSTIRGSSAPLSDYTTYGYVCGGNGSSSVVDKITFETSIVTAHVISLSVAKYGAAGVSDIVNGYIAGGYSTANTATTDKMIYSSGAIAANTTSNISTTRRYVCGLSDAVMT